MMSFKKVSFAVMFSAFALAQSAGAATIVPVPAPVVTTATSPEGPVSGEFQGMVTSVTQGSVSINSNVLQVTGDTVITYNGGLTSLTAGQIANYSYATDVDGVMIATTIDAYPTQAVSGTARVYGLNVDNATGGVQLYLGYGGAWATYTGPAVEYFQPYAFISGIGTNTSYGAQLVNYSGFVNPTSGRILATGGAMMDIPVTFKPTLAQATVGQDYNQYTMELGIYGVGDVYMVTATGLPAGLSMSTNGVISGTPTTAGTYTVSMTAMCGQHCVAPYTAVGQGSVTIVVASNVVTPPADTTAPSITMYGTDVTLTAGTSYVDAGATCTDNVDATCTVTTTSTVDTTTAGTYTVTYGATDVAGNIATSVVRTVTVTPVVQVMTCSGVDQVITSAANVRGSILEIGGGPSNGGIAIQISQSSTAILPPLTASTFFAAGNLISFTGTMSATNLCVATSATISAPVVVIPADTTAPSITMNGTDVTLTAGTSYVDAGATCTDNVDATCTVTTTSTVDTTTAGTYTVTYGATDVAGNIATSVVRTVTITPVILTTTGSGIITSIGRDFLVINGGLNAADHVFYTPTAAGTSFFGGVTTFATGEYVTFTGDVDALGAVHATSMSVYPAVAFVTTLANAQATVAYTATNLMVSGMAPFDVIASGVPTGMTVSTTGVLTGTPTTAGTYTITLFATDSIGNVDTAVVTLVIAAAPVVVAPPTVVVSTGKKVEATKQVVTAVSATSVTVGTTIIRITPTTVLSLNKGKPIAVGNKIEYKGVLNTDGSVTATSIKIQ